MSRTFQRSAFAGSASEILSNTLSKHHNKPKKELNWKVEVITSGCQRLKESSPCRVNCWITNVFSWAFLLPGSSKLGS